MEEFVDKRKKKIKRIVGIIILIMLILLLLRTCSKKEGVDSVSVESSSVSEETALIDDNQKEDDPEIVIPDEPQKEESEEDEDDKTFSYWVNFLNIDDSVLQRTVCEYGETPVYNGDTPTYSDGIYSYTFRGWDRPVSKVTFTQTYKATYSMLGIVTAPTAITPLTYNGTSQKLINAGSTTDGTMVYKLDDGEYSTAIPSATDAGTYTVYYKVINSLYGAGSNEQSLNVTIDKAYPSATAPLTETLIYNGSDQNLATAGVTNGGEWKYRLEDTEYSTAIPTGKDKRTYRLYYWLDGGKNYYDIAEAYADVEIAGYLTFTANTAGSTVTPKFDSGDWSYSFDGVNWTDVERSDTSNYNKTTITLANVGDRVMLKGTNCKTSLYHYFTMTGSIAASGEVTSLTNGIGGDTTLTEGCYQRMFYGCSSLTTAPALPATTLAYSCYYGMFSNCFSLTTAPALPATTLTSCCYRQMFNNCISLTTAPALPATTLAIFCYYHMFTNCFSLTTAPELPATTLADYCYCGMFYECSSLKVSSSDPTGTTEKGQIFTCPSLSGLDDPTLDMFGCVSTSVKDTPSQGETYYWFK